MYLFPGEITIAQAASFARVQQRLLERLKRRVQEGTLTERGLARASGLSQPHVHNLLKGVRAPTVESSDALLGALDPGAAADLFRFDEPPPPNLAAGPSAGIPFLSGVAGPGAPWVDGWRTDQRFQALCSALAGLRQPAALLVQPDAEMRLGGGVLIVDCSFDAEAFPVCAHVYLVIAGGCGAARWIRPGRDCLYLATDANLDRPAAWERVSRDTRVVARVVMRPGERRLREDES